MTQNTEKNGYVYAIAGGQTLELIQRLTREEAEARAAIEALVKPSGVRVAFMNEYPVFTVAGEPPVGWRMETAGLTPNSGLAGQIEKHKEGLMLRRKFDQVCARAGTGNEIVVPKGAYTFEVIGGTTIVSCPMSERQSEDGRKKEDVRRIPQGCTVITADRYQAFKNNQ